MAAMLRLRLQVQGTLPQALEHLLAGEGGDLGSAGATASHSGGGKNITPYAGGAGGAAVNGNAPTWVTVGTIYGTRV
ncbi:hypothetical protein ABP88_004009 [Salmonella enterica subsp. enterica serovar Braenderup]|nr:hypothetical protein [Salmonella enterica subsp. enterica serovar Braenderup]